MANDSDILPPTTAQVLFDQMLEKIRCGEWPVGKTIPSERVLMKQLGVSRLALREALSMLRSLGVLKTSRGSGSTVCPVNADFLAKLFPLAVTLEDQNSFEQLFEVRIAIEAPAAFFAAQRRTDADLALLTRLAKKFENQAQQRLPERAPTDLQFHLAIARASRNRIFAALLNVISGYTVLGLMETWKSTDSLGEESALWCERAIHAHGIILQAIRDGDAELARAEMVAHLRYGATLVPRIEFRAAALKA